MVSRVAKMRLDSGSKFFVLTQYGWEKVNRRRFFDEKRRLQKRFLRGDEIKPKGGEF